MKTSQNAYTSKTQIRVSVMPVLSQLLSQVNLFTIRVLFPKNLRANGFTFFQVLSKTLFKTLRVKFERTGKKEEEWKIFVD